MTVALTILGAALLGGVVFMLLERWQRDGVKPAAVPEPPTTMWTPISATEPTRPIWTPDEDTSRTSWGPSAAESRWAPEAETRPLPEPEQQTRPLPPRRESPPLWTPPPGRAGHWDDDDRHRDEDDDRRPPGLWSGWADR